MTATYEDRTMFSTTATSGRELFEPVAALKLETGDEIWLKTRASVIDIAHVPRLLSDVIEYVYLAVRDRNGIESSMDVDAHAEILRRVQ